MSLRLIGPDPRLGRLVHHVALCPKDLEQSLRFYRAGIGLEVLLDEVIRDDWQALFGARSNRLRSLFLGDPKRPDAGIVELVAFDAGVEVAPGLARPSTGFFLISFLVDVDATLARLASLGLDAGLRVLATRFGAKIAVVRDPDGVWVELIPAAPVPVDPRGAGDGA